MALYRATGAPVGSDTFIELWNDKALRRILIGEDRERLNKEREFELEKARLNVEMYNRMIRMMDLYYTYDLQKPGMSTTGYKIKSVLRASMQKKLTNEDKKDFLKRQAQAIRKMKNGK